MMQDLRNNPVHKDVEHFEFVLKNGLPVDASCQFEDANEFSYKGKMYDVIYEKRTGNMLYIACINDKKEEGLLKELSNIQLNQNNKPLKNGFVIQFVFGFFFFEEKQEQNMALRSQSNEHYSKYDHSLSSFAKDITTPPPRS